MNKRPFHLWFFAILAVLWNLVGAVDYTLTQLQQPAYMAQFTPEQTAYFQSFPTWVVAAWATAVWAGLLGAVFLVARSGLSVGLFALSFAAMLVTAVHNFWLSDVSMAEIAGPEAIWFSLLIMVIGFAEWLYARWNRRMGVLG